MMQRTGDDRSIGDLLGNLYQGASQVVCLLAVCRLEEGT